jgi:hypothetical protein
MKQVRPRLALGDEGGTSGRSPSTGESQGDERRRYHARSQQHSSTADTQLKHR